MFPEYHPAVNFLYFALVIVFTAVFQHPVMLGISLFSVLAYTAAFAGGRALFKKIRGFLPLALLAALVNVLFSHRGATILAYFPSGNPLTLESLAFGALSAAMLTGMLLWFSCCSRVMDADKFVLLFGKAAPQLGLLLSMTLRFVPLFIERFRAVSEAQRAAGRTEEAGTFSSRVRAALTELSAVLTWSLEAAGDTADSMHSRGYGLAGRTAFSPCRWRARDRAALLWLFLCGGSVLVLWAAGGAGWHCYPTLSGHLSPAAALFYAGLCLTPVFLNGWEGRAWKRSALRI